MDISLMEVFCFAVYYLALFATALCLSSALRKLIRGCLDWSYLVPGLILGVVALVVAPYAPITEYGGWFFGGMFAFHLVLGFVIFRQ